MVMISQTGHVAQFTVDDGIPGRCVGTQTKTLFKPNTENSERQMLSQSKAQAASTRRSCAVSVIPEGRFCLAGFPLPCCVCFAVLRLLLIVQRKAQIYQRQACPVCIG
ncbi:hypothetical protein ACQKEK_10100 [Pseudomonas sp. NPDC077408]